MTFVQFKVLKKISSPGKSRVCYLCATNKKVIDYRDTALLSRFVSSFMKIAARKRSGLCAKHQRQVAKAIKRSRQSGLMPYLPE